MNDSPLDQPLFTALNTLHLHWLIQLLPYWLAIKFIAKPIENTIHNFIMAKMTANITRVGSDNDLFMRALLESKLYRFGNVLLDFVFSIELPSLNDYIKMLPPLSIQIAKAESTNPQPKDK